ncbi:TRAP transporter substrate-binding protein DctP [Pseudooceanicola sp.]|uniref:TRAP transporter substrate-binding protein DctP n=1 Tax=Pseudooceanicola sp. TaxID=1914328 RepID=UPI0035C6C2DB
MKTTKTNRRAFLRGAAVGTLAAPAFIGKAIAQGKVNWRVQCHWPKASSSFDGSLGALVRYVEERTDGAFKFETFGAGEFAKGPDIYALVRKGVVPMATISPSYFQDKAETASFYYGIPGTFKEAWEMQNAIKNLGLEDLLNEELAADGLLIRSEKIYPTEMVASKKIETAEDFSGLKIRSSGTTLDYLKAAGAAPQYIPGSELYQSLSSGVVDGAHWGAAVGAQSMSLWEVCKYHYRTPLGLNSDAYIVNMDALNDIDAELAETLLDAMEIRHWRRTAEYFQLEAIALAEGVRDDGLEILELPSDVVDLMTAATNDILEMEGQKGEKAAKAADIYRKLLSDLGYT